MLQQRRHLKQEHGLSLVDAGEDDEIKQLVDDSPDTIAAADRRNGNSGGKGEKLWKSRRKGQGNTGNTSSTSSTSTYSSNARYASKSTNVSKSTSTRGHASKSTGTSGNASGNSSSSTNVSHSVAPGSGPLGSAPVGKAAGGGKGAGGAKGSRGSKEAKRPRRAKAAKAGKGEGEKSSGDAKVGKGGKIDNAPKVPKASRKEAAEKAGDAEDDGVGPLKHHGEEADSITVGKGEWKGGKWSLWKKSGPTHCDIKQGSLGSCYILATLAAIAHYHPGIIQALFVERDRWKWANPVFTISFRLTGVRHSVAVDSLMPVGKDGKTFFAHPHEDTGQTAIWHMLVEKAWAKIFTSYKGAENGFLYEAIRGITNAPVKIYFQDGRGGFEKEALWSAMVNSTTSKYPMVGGTVPAATSLGLAAGHAYAILGASVHNSERGLLMYNPWGSDGYKGKLAKQTIASTKLQCSEFMMTYDEFYTAFNYVEIAEVKPNYAVTSKAISTGEKITVTFTKKKNEPFAVQLQWPTWRLMQAAHCQVLDANVKLVVTPPTGPIVTSTLRGIYKEKGLSSIWAIMPAGAGKYSVVVHADFLGNGKWLKRVFLNTYASERPKFTTSKKLKITDHVQSSCDNILKRFDHLDNSKLLKKGNDPLFPPKGSSIGPSGAMCGDPAQGIMQKCSSLAHSWKKIGDLKG